MAINMTLSCEHPFGQEWRIDKEIGKGSYGVVYQLSRNDAGESITSAMKWIPLPGDDAEIQRMYAEGLTRTSVREYYEKLKAGFSEEIQLLYRLRGNSHVVSLEDYKIIPREGDNAVGYDIFIRMELLTSLEKWLLKKKTITYRDIVQIGEDLCDALNDCSRLSIIHRDIKPDNIFVTDDNRFKLGDFGIARRLQREDLNASQRVGSLGYMSPEVFHAQIYDLRADLYSLGLVLYKLLNDRREPFSPPAPEIVTPQIANKANETRLSGSALPKPEKIPDSLERLWDIIQKACEYQPSNRYQTPLEMKKAFQSIESLSALDEPLELFHRDTVVKNEKKEERKEMDEGEENSPSSSSSSAINETRYRTPSSLNNLNQTSPRTSDTNNKNKGIVSSSKQNNQPKTIGVSSKGPVPKKWIVMASVGALLLIAGILIAVLSGTGRTVVSSKWTIMADEVSETSITLSWTDGPTADVVCSCFQNEAQIRQEVAATCPFTVSGLTPGKEYLFILTSGNESSQISVSTATESSSGQIPLIQRVDLFSIKVKYLENTSLARADGSYFDRISDNVLHLRSGPTSAQIASQTIWILFPSVSNSQPLELVMSVEIPEKAVFSRSTVLNLSDSSTSVTYRVALDELLGDIYACYHAWPREECILRLYLNGMSVYDTAIRLESGN